MLLCWQELDNTFLNRWSKEVVEMFSVSRKASHTTFAAYKQELGYYSKPNWVHTLLVWLCSQIEQSFSFWCHSFIFKRGMGLIRARALFGQDTLLYLVYLYYLLSWLVRYFPSLHLRSNTFPWLTLGLISLLVRYTVLWLTIAFLSSTDTSLHFTTRQILFYGSTSLNTSLIFLTLTTLCPLSLCHCGYRVLFLHFLQTVCHFPCKTQFSLGRS